MPNGFEILKIEERYEAGQAPLADVENEIMEKLSMPQMQPKVRELLTKLREDAFLEIRAGYVDSGAAPNKDTAWKDPAQLKPETTTKEEVASHKQKETPAVGCPDSRARRHRPKKVETARRPGDSTGPAASPTCRRATGSRPRADPQPAAAGSVRRARQAMKSPYVKEARGQPNVHHVASWSAPKRFAKRKPESRIFP